MVIFTANAMKISILTPGRSRKTPSNYGAAVHNNTEGQDSTADVSTAKVGWHLNTHTNGTFPQSLTNCQLHVEYGNTFNCQQDKIRDQECNCKELKPRTRKYFLHSSLHTINMAIYQLFCSNILWLCEECKTELHI